METNADSSLPKVPSVNGLNHNYVPTSPNGEVLVPDIRDAPNIVASANNNDVATQESREIQIKAAESQEKLSLERERLAAEEEKKALEAVRLEKELKEKEEQERVRRRQELEQQLQKKKKEFIKHAEEEAREDQIQKQRAVNQGKAAIQLQKAILGKLLGRINTSFLSLQVIIKFFADRAAIAQKYALLMQDLPKLRTLGESGTLDMSLNYLDRITNTEIEEYNNFGTHVRDNTCKALYVLKEEVKVVLQKMQKKANTLSTDMDRIIELVSQSHQQFEQALQQAREYVAKGKQEYVVKDPYLIKIKANADLKMFGEAMDSFNDHLLHLFQELKEIDCRRIDVIKNCFKDYLAKQKSALVKIAKDVDIAAAVVGSQTNEDFWTFARQAELVVNDKPFEATLPKRFINPERNIYASKSVIRCGDLEMGSLIRWNKYTFILTKFGFLHYFYTLVGLEPQGSIPLFMCEIVINDPTKNTFQIIYTPSGMFSTTKKYLLRATNEAHMVEWIIDLKKYIKINK